MSTELDREEKEKPDQIPMNSRAKMSHCFSPFSEDMSLNMNMSASCWFRRKSDGIIRQKDLVANN